MVKHYTNTHEVGLVLQRRVNADRTQMNAYLDHVSNIRPCELSEPRMAFASAYFACLA